MWDEIGSCAASADGYSDVVVQGVGRAKGGSSCKGSAVQVVQVGEVTKARPSAPLEKMPKYVHWLPPNQERDCQFMHG